MRLNIQRITAQHIIGVGAVREFIWACVNNLKLGIGFHPDTTFDEYIIKEGKRKDKPVFTTEEADELDKRMIECFEQCKKLELDICAITLEITKPVFDVSKIHAIRDDIINKCREATAKFKQENKK